ncbi:MAG: hypothetical protein A2W91_02805 [Bacteroidetes bacterium GWF2_38_335]|nr:MAG: hypothetical protein A2W91_02805 [Bacteroidetes bacterium GWF2_38_335]OFY77576.1 MAG: hypothetical protein A2281_01955 [Bacteroidetes bacterium RIFOXYA12_FULL_38_20]HBS87123.1 hypothetical protein [Bacteroidales bacterium]
MNSIFANRQQFIFLTAVLLQLLTVVGIYILYISSFKPDGFFSEDFAIDFTRIILIFSGFTQIFLISISNYIIIKSKTTKEALLLVSFRNFPFLVIGALMFYGGLVVSGIL